MADLNFDSEIANDISLDRGDLSFTSDVSVAEGIRQDARASLLLFEGEYFLAPDEQSGIGVSWIRDVFRSKPFSVEKVDRVVRDALLRVDGVGSVEEIRINLDRGGRQLGIDFICKTDDGTLIADNLQVG